MYVKLLAPAHFDLFEPPFNIHSCSQTKDSQKWRFLTEKQVYQFTLPKDNGSLTTGIYRIRSLDGTVFISLPESLSSIEPRAKDPKALTYPASKEEVVGSQKVKHLVFRPNRADRIFQWLVTRSDHGTYSIQDSEQHLFLGCVAYDCYKYGPVHGLREAFDWDITPVGGGFAYTYVELASSSKALVLKCY